MEETPTTAPAPIEDRVIIKLTHPIKHGSEIITELRIRPGRLGDIRGIKITEKGLDGDHLIAIASRMTGQPKEAIMLLSGEDCAKVMPMVMTFFGLCLSGGSGQ